MDFSHTPVTLILLILNVLVSGYGLYMDPSIVDRFAFKPRRILDGEYYRLISGGFVHVSMAHLVFNMFTLFFFGRVMEVILGPGAFLILYFGSELAAHALSLVLHRDNPSYAAVGASGAISGVLFSYCLFEPFEMILVFFIPMPAIVFAVVYVVGSIYAMRVSREPGGRGMTGGIAHEAHLGGALGGLLLTILLEPGSLNIFFGALRNAF